MCKSLGVNWEHVVASNDNVRIPERPLKITDVLMQENIDPLDMITEAFVRELNPRSIDEKTGDKQRKQAATRIKDPRNPEESLYSLFGVIRITRFSCVWVVLMENHSLFHVVGHIRCWRSLIIQWFPTVSRQSSPYWFYEIESISRLLPIN